MLKYFFIGGGILAIIVGAFLMFRGGQKFGDAVPLPDPAPDPVPIQTLTDQDIYNAVLTAQINGTLPQFSVDQVEDLTRITAQYIKVAKDKGVDTTDPTPEQPNLYLATRVALVAGGTPVQPLSAEAATSMGVPVDAIPEIP